MSHRSAPGAFGNRIDLVRFLQNLLSMLLKHPRRSRCLQELLLDELSSKSIETADTRVTSRPKNTRLLLDTLSTWAVCLKLGNARVLHRSTRITLRQEKIHTRRHVLGNQLAWIAQSPLTYAFGFRCTSHAMGPVGKRLSHCHTQQPDTQLLRSDDAHAETDPQISVGESKRQQP